MNFKIKQLKEGYIVILMWELKEKYRSNLYSVNGRIVLTAEELKAMTFED